VSCKRGNSLGRLFRRERFKGGGEGKGIFYIAALCVGYLRREDEITGCLRGERDVLWTGEGKGKFFRRPTKTSVGLKHVGGDAREERTASGEGQTFLEKGPAL